MRRILSVVRLLIALLFVGLIANCSDNPTGPTRNGAPPISLATASNGAGLSITTDKDDYAPGDTVWFTGAGWTPGDSVDIALTDDPTQDSHNWAVGIGEDGGFRDSTYVVDINDLGVTFTLTATSRGNPEQTLTVTFTDGTLSLAAPTKPAGFQSFPVPSPFPAAGITFTAANSASPAAAHTNVTLRIRAAGNLNPTPPTLQRELLVTASLAAGSQASVAWDGNNGSATPLAEGLYGVRVFSSQRTEQNNSDLDILVDRTPPAISSPAVSLSSVTSGTNTAVTLTGTATDPTVSDVNANNYKVLSARYQLDGTPAGGTAMSPADGNFNSQTEGLTVTIPGATIAGLSVGSHLFCMRATDAAGNAGAFTITGNPNCATLEITSADAQAPTINCTVPEQSIWYDADVAVHCTASDPSGLKNSGDASFSLSTSVAAGTETATAQTNSRQVCDNGDNCATAGPYTFMVDKKSPEISCGSADGQWHGADVSVNCTATDGGSGLANPADASFSLTTSVAAGTETSNASTGTRSIADKLGHSATAGPITGNMVDKKDPTIVCGTADGAWHATDASVACTASDGGSGLANPADASFSLTTSVPANSETSNASTNSHSVADAVGNSATAGPISGNKVDKKDPEISCGTADGLWHATDVSIACTASDGGSGLADAGDVGFNLTTSVVSGTETSNASTGTHNVSDGVGNTATAGPISGNKVDKKGPTVNLVCPALPVILGSTQYANWTASDGGSGVASGFESGQILLATGTVGSKTGTAAEGTSVDKVTPANKSPEATCNYSVIYLWTGFFQPVDNANLNVAKGGSGIPVKFNLGGNQGLAIFVAASPSSSKVACDNQADQDTIEETVNAGGSSLTYDLTASQYIYVWKTDKAWAGTCRRLDLKLIDGTTHWAYFKFK